MNNADMPANPIPVKRIADDFVRGIRDSKTLGLTKREYFAGLALQGLLSGVNAGSISHNWDARFFAYNAMKMADALLKGLEE